ncbi:pectin methylesterase inhibitor 1 [Euphorbia peplus]|nr:pectin methylesterase inhibitor 1 [Euphorbia peplus]
MKISKVEQQKVCSGIQDSSFCFQCLKSIPHITQIDLHGLCKVLLNTTHSKSVETYNMIKALPKATYDCCIDDFDAANGDLENAIEAFKIDNFEKLEMMVGAAFTNGGSCLDNFDYPGPPLPMDPSLRKKIENFKTLCDMLLNIVHVLQ